MSKNTGKNESEIVDNFHLFWGLIFSNSNSGECTQLALRLEREVESFEFYQSDTPPEILLSLRFPVHEVFVQSKNDIQNNISSNSLYKRPDKSTKYKRINEFVK